MIGLIWNCRGAFKKGFSTFLKDLMDEYKVDYICLQETMRKKYNDKIFRTIDSQKNFNWHWIPSKGKSGGMLSGIKMERFDVDSFENSDHIIIANIFDKKLNKHLSLANVYGPAQEKHKDLFLCELANMCSKCKYPILIGGDFNILQFSEVKN